MMDLLASHRDRLPSHAIDTQEKIQNRADCRNEPDHENPKGGSARLALVDYCVSGRDQCRHKDDGADCKLKDCHP